MPTPTSAIDREVPELGMWTFLASEVLFFGGLFAAYAVYRSAYPAGFAEASRRLELPAGAANTLILISSGLAMALAVAAARAGELRGAFRRLAVSGALGVAFLGVKAYEYAEKFRHHLVPGPRFAAAEFANPSSQLFFSFYFVMTGLHALHMAIGLGVMAYFLVAARRLRSPETSLEMLGLYWHFVDIVWLFLFPLLYLVGRHA